MWPPPLTKWNSPLDHLRRDFCLSPVSLLQGMLVSIGSSTMSATMSLWLRKNFSVPKIHIFLLMPLIKGNRRHTKRNVVFLAIERIKTV